MLPLACGHGSFLIFSAILTCSSYPPHFTLGNKLNWIDQIWFYFLCRYTIEMFRKGYKKALEFDDLYSLLKADQSQLLGDKLERWVCKNVSGYEFAF